MAVNIPRGPTAAEDDGVRQVSGALEQYLADHPGAVADVYRHGRYSLKVRVVDPSFAGVRRGARHERVWNYLGRLPEEVYGEVHSLIPITPDEQPESVGNFEFDHPIPANDPEPVAP